MGIGCCVKSKQKIGFVKPGQGSSIGPGWLVLVLALVLSPSLFAQESEATAEAQEQATGGITVTTQTTLQTPWRTAVPNSAIGFVGWNAWATSPRSPENNAQAVLAEPEVERFIQDVIRRIGGLPRQAMSNAPPAIRRAASRLTTNLIESFFLRSGCLYLDRLVPPSEGAPPVIEACAWLEVGAEADAVLKDLRTLLADTPAEVVDVQVAGQPFMSFDSELGPDAKLYVGVVEQCLVVSISERSLAESLKRKTAGNEPNWLKEAESKHGLNQLQGLGRFDFAKLWAQMLPALVEMGIGEQEMAVVRSLGLERLQSIETVDGFAQQHRINRVQVNLEPGTGGVWSLFDGPGLSARDLRQLPSDTLFCYSVAMDLPKSLQYFEQFITQIDGPDSNPISEFYEEVYEETGVDIEAEILEPLGHAWTFHNAAADGWFSGLALSVSIQDQATFSKGLSKLVDSYRRETEQDPQMGKITERKLGDLTISSLSFPTGPIPVMPSWTIHNGQLVVTLFPDTIPAIVRQPETNLVESSAEIQEILAGDGSTEAVLMFSYVDMQRQFEIIYPYAQMLLAMGSNATRSLGSSEAEMFDELLNGLMLPPSRVIHRHLLPTISTVKRNSQGIRFESRTTFPTVDVTVMAPVGVGLLLPAVQQARVAARRAQSANNLKQIALAVLNYESAYRKFPAAYNQSEDNKPLLSWRVHILPYIEQGNLYEQFHLDEPWDSPHNLALLELMPETYRGPQSQAAPGYTVYLGSSGKDAALGLPTQTGQASAASGQRISAIVDGMSNTILAVEVSDEMAVPWTKPDSEIDFQACEPWRFYGQFPGGVNVAFCDASVRFLSYMEDSAWKIFLQINDGEVPPMDSDW
ncbi:MAG: DUF1559 domain-containing protein [Planctomycetaceae bacterium]|nr:DUF1559 domain-containing protein [Planctomycetaceae bacterium]